MEEERRVVCTVMRLFTSKVGGTEEEEKGEEDWAVARFKRGEGSDVCE